MKSKRKEKLSKRKVKKQKTRKKASMNSGSSFFGALVIFLKKMFLFFLILSSVILFSYFFIFPAIVNKDSQSKNILIISSKLDVSSNNIYFTHISGSKEKNTFISLPAKKMVVVPNGYGEYPLQSVFQLLKIDKKDDQFIKATFSELLGTAIDEIITVDKQLNEIDENDFAKFFLTDSLNHLVKFQLHKIYQPLFLHYQSKNNTLVTIDNLQELNDIKDSISTITSDVYQYCSVAVINSSEINGLAQRKADIIENTGALVVRVDDTEDKHNQTQIYFGYGPVDCEGLATKISYIFYKKPELLPIEKLKNAQQYRAKIIIIVGE